MRLPFSSAWFQSTYLYKVRHLLSKIKSNNRSFNPRTYIRYDYRLPPTCKDQVGFNPRTYIRYDIVFDVDLVIDLLFQSTYLYKVRLSNISRSASIGRFQSTYLYKVRLMPMMFPIQTKMFQSTYLYKVRLLLFLVLLSVLAFQSTYLYKVRRKIII